VAQLRLFGPAREAAGDAQAQFPGRNVGEVVAAAEHLFGGDFSRIVALSRIWLNGDDAELDASVGDADEIAVIPPVSGG
jgi:molybdopterin converting factor small subunit